MENAIDVTGLVTQYGDRVILKNITFAVPRGMTTVRLGEGADVDKADR